ncbi:hypothetical protein AAKU55_004724 [Oxalobacteraceae bacterium GrIS 1.11]
MRSLSATCLLFAACALAWAGPAPWYQWRSRADGHYACRQTTPGFGWERAIGPYKDSRCEKMAIAK